MKNFYVLLLALVISGVAFAQYTSKQNAVNNIKETKRCIVPNIQNTNKDVMVTFFSDGFESGNLTGGGWTEIDNDGDGETWFAFDGSGPPQYSHTGSYLATSASWNGSAFTPDNYLVTPAIDLSAASGTVFLEWFVAGQDQTWPSEYYEVKVSTTTATVAAFTDVIHTETVQAAGPEPGNYWQRSVDVSAYSGQTIYIAFHHKAPSYDMFRINIDDVSVYENTIIDAALTDIIAPNNSGGCALTASENVTVTITNYGGAAITGFDVSYSINGGASVTETVSATVNPAASYDYTFAQTGDFSALGYYIINASVDLTGDSDGSNDNFGGAVTSGDAYIEVIVSTDAGGGQSWEIYNSTNTLIASHGAYQWNLTNDLTTVCLLDNDCYTFYWYGGTSNDVEVTYNGVTENSTTATGDWTVFGIGGNCPALDASLTALTFPAYAMPSTDIDITGTVQNIGTDNITSFDVVYTINGGAPIGPYSATCNMATGQTYDFTHDVVFNNAVEATYLIEVTISNVNGGGETNLANNVLSKNILITSSMIQRLVVFEEFSTEQCPNCPPVVTYLHDYMATEPNMVIMTHHSAYYDDFLTIPESENDMVELFNDGGSTYAPAGCADRYFFDDAGITGDTDPGPAFWCGNPYGGNAIAARVAEPAFTTVEICGTYSQTTHVLDAEIFGDFVNDFTGTIGVSFWITENNIPESTSPGQAGATSAWTHYYAVRDVLSDVWGDEITTPTTVGNSYSETYNFNVNASWVYNELYLVAFVNEIDAADPNNREIHNAFSVKLSDIAVCQTGNNSIFLEEGIQMYPNPTTGILNLINVENSSIEIYNILGENVLTIKSANSIEQIDLSNYNNGTYIIKVKTENSVVTEKIVLDN